jgi:hypothetical protein
MTFARSDALAIRWWLLGFALASVLVLALAPAPAHAQASGTEPQAAAPAGSELLSAQWVEKNLNFVYQGFTTHYSCDGLRDQMIKVLTQLGARKDMKVRERGCTSPTGRPEPFPGVDATFSVLEPVPVNGVVARQMVPARWEPMKLDFGRGSLDQAGQCELIEQVKHKVLPLFTTRNVDFTNTCVPHQLTPGGTRLEAEILKPAATRSADTAPPPG